MNGNLNIDSYGDKSYGIRVIGGTVDVQKNTVINMYGTILLEYIHLKMAMALLKA